MKSKVFIAGGGTGGHIYPALAIAKSLMLQDSNIEIHFVGTELGLEKEIIPRENFKIHFISIDKLNLKGQWVKKVKTLLSVPLALFQSYKLLRKYKPNFILGVGGYASGPFVFTASLLGYPTGIWEPNAKPGLANQILSRFVDVSFLVFEKAKVYLKPKSFLVLGMPIRLEIESQLQNIRKQREARKSDKTNNKFRILCFGGSQGARVINQNLSTLLLDRPELGDIYEVVHQIGKNDWTSLKDKYAPLASWVTPFEFIFDMPKYYEWADLVICRAGASTLAEVSAFGVPAILIPLSLADGHQLENAKDLVNQGGAVLIEQNNLTPEKLFEEIELLRQSDQKRRQMENNLLGLFQSNAAGLLAQAIRERIKL